MNAHNQSRFGTARFATRAEIARAGYFRKTKTSLYALNAFGKMLWVPADLGSMSVVAGSQGGKGTSFIIPNTLSGVMPETSSIQLDLKGELSEVSQDMTPDGKICIYFNPTGMHGRAGNRFNPFSHLNKGSPSLVSDAQVTAENMIPRTSSGQGSAYFELRGQEFLTSIMLAVAERDGEVTAPALYEAVNLIPGGGERWIEFAFIMHSCGYELSFNVEEEIAVCRDDSSGGFRGIVGEVIKSVSPLADPQLRDALSPPFDFSLGQLCDPSRSTQFYLMCPPEKAQLWSPILKSIFVCAMIEKMRRPDAPRQVWMLDEAGQLGAFPLLLKLHSFAAGIGITNISIFQSSKQMDNLGPNGQAVILSSSALQINFAIRDIEEAKRISDILGVQTLKYDRRLNQAEATMRRREIVQELLRGGDPFELNARLGHFDQASSYQHEDRRPLRTPDEVMNGPEGEAFVFADGVRYPILAQRVPYFENRAFAYRYHPNPYYPPSDRVRVQTLFGKRWRRVHRTPVPERYAHLPQYRDGFWSTIER
ncbi:MAG: type IV secretory system conjugative DNA transfer family protein [Paracoccaceae bacterium]